jgi:DNA repair protein RadC
MVEFGRYIDLPVLDHIIFTDNGYYSFADEGKL